MASFLLSLREGLEAALIIGIVLGALRKFGRVHLNRYVWAGIGVALALSVLAAVLLTSLGATLTGQAEQIYEGGMMFLAAAVLTWMIFWMRGQGRFIKRDLEAGIQQAVAQPGKRALFFLAFLAVFREGLELALFLTAAAFTADSLQVIAGTLLGLSGAAVLGWLLFASTVRLDTRRFFTITGLLLILFAAGLVAHGVHEFNEAALIPEGIEHIWNLNPLLNEKSPLGEILTTLFGYNANPSLSETFAYIGYFLIISLALYLEKFRLFKSSTNHPQVS